MSSTSDRKAELERKKAKLQALREEKDRRRREKEQKDAEEAVQRASNPSSLDSRRDLDEMLSSLGVAPVKDVLSSLSSMPSLTTQTAPSTDSSLLPPPSLDLQSGHGRRSPTHLTVVSVQSTDIPPRENVSYTKQTQTATTGHHDRDAHTTDYYVLTFDDERVRQGEEDEGGAGGGGGGSSFHGKLPPGILPHGLPTVKEVPPAVTQQETRKAEEEKKEKKPRELSADEKQTIMLSSEFQQFMSRAGRLVERALAEVDVTPDYTHRLDPDTEQDDKSDARLSLVRSFYDERWSRGRCVTCLDWCAIHPELMLASYHNSDDAPHDPDGVCLVWNTKFKKTTPEEIFHCQSPVMSATFARFHPNLILGGTYSGQIVLWDNRVPKRTPVQRSPLSSQAHTHPVYCLNVVGSQNAHNVMSVSTDGRMCSWSLDMLAAPQETLDLQHRQSKAVAVTALAFPHGDVNNFILGSEDGNLYTGCRHGQRAGVSDCLEGHAGPVTAVSCHAVPGPVDFSHLYLTSSMDWTIKLWSTKESKPLYSLEDSGDYVVDVRWSPAHPALFAAVDAAGRLDLWNLVQDTEVPAASVQAEGGVAFNRVSWTPSGSHVTAGDDTGRIWVYEVGEQLATPRHDDYNKMALALQELRHHQVDDDADRLALAGPPPQSLGSLSSLASLTSLTSAASNPLR